jgi:hypothetical protein
MSNNKTLAPGIWAIWSIHCAQQITTSTSAPPWRPPLPSLFMSALCPWPLIGCMTPSGTVPIHGSPMYYCIYMLWPHRSRLFSVKRRSYASQLVGSSRWFVIPLLLLLEVLHSTSPPIGPKCRSARQATPETTPEAKDHVDTPGYHTQSISTGGHCQTSHGRPSYLRHHSLLVSPGLGQLCSVAVAVISITAQPPAQACLY